MKSPGASRRYHILANRKAPARADARRVGSGACPRHSTRPVPTPYVSAGDDSMIGEDVMVPSSETDQLRQQLLQAQRLSSVGALASSVAHEFNNILTTIINYARLALRHRQDELARTQALEKILKGSQRAATIINSMLGFARNTATQREMTDLVG